MSGISSVFIGGTAGGYYDGLMDEIRIYDGVLSGSAISELFASYAQDGFSVWARNLGLTGAASDPTRDLDGDGFTNMEEFLSGFNPTNASSLFVVESIQQINDPDKEVVVTWESKEGRVYTVSQSTNLLSDEFKVVQDDIEYPQNSATVDVSTVESSYLRVDVRLR